MMVTEILGGDGEGQPSAQLSIDMGFMAEGLDKGLLCTKHMKAI